MGKSCCSHDVTGTCFGYFYMGCSGIGFIHNMIYFVLIVFNRKPSYPEDILPTLFFALITFISFLFVLAIEKRRPFLILPWLVFGLFVCCITLYYAWVAMEFLLWRNTIVSYMLVIILIVAFVITVVINAFILFVKICRENRRNGDTWDRLNRETDNICI